MHLHKNVVRDVDGVGEFAMGRFQPKTEEFLNLLLWTAEMFMRPTFRNLTGSYESWAYRNGLLRQVQQLESRSLIEGDPSGERSYRLTKAGLRHALGGRNPEECWARAWDGQWRMILFDIPVDRNAHRNRLTNYLRGRGFGLLQNSVWITPDTLESEAEILAGGRIDVASMILLAARPCAGESDAEIVESSWDFDRINERYHEYESVLSGRPTGRLRDERDAEAMRRWVRAEHRAWLATVENDPLLPERILPAGYRGRRAWNKRKKALLRAAKHLREFTC